MAIGLSRRSLSAILIEIRSFSFEENASENVFCNFPIKICRPQCVKLGIMMTSSNENIFRVTGNLCGEFPSQRPVTRSPMFSLICVWINNWVNNRAAGDSRRYRTHYGVIVKKNLKWCCHSITQSTYAGSQSPWLSHIELFTTQDICLSRLLPKIDGYFSVTSCTCALIHNSEIKDGSTGPMIRFDIKIMSYRERQFHIKR